MRDDVMKAVLVTWELMNQSLTDAAAEAIVGELIQHDEGDVLLALTICRKELRRITLADVLDRIPGGHPGVEEAWAVCARWVCDGDERSTFFWTDEIAEAAGIASAVGGDKVAAHMAFKEKYTALVEQAKREQRKPQWRICRGTDKGLVTETVAKAVLAGKITYEHGKKLIPHDISDDDARGLLGGLSPGLLE
jgi:hypothetical protein